MAISFRTPFIACGDRGRTWHVLVLDFGARERQNQKRRKITALPKDKEAAT
jgi:hypothetical protein